MSSNAYTPSPLQPFPRTWVLYEFRQFECAVLESNETRVSKVVAKVAEYLLCRLTPNNRGNQSGLLACEGVENRGVNVYFVTPRARGVRFDCQPRNG